jgi:dTDP-4-amino-4,6-dideoxygalactose transaminase
MKIPLSKIIIDDEIKQSVLKVLSSGKFILGNETREFEEKFAKFCNVKYSACVNSGTSALFLTLKTLGVKTGDEIIVPSLSFIATATPILMCGAKPKFVDVNNKNYTIDPIEIENAITKKTKGIIPVHLYGHAANMNKIKKIAKNNSLFVVEDAAQAHGAKYNDKMIGSLGDAAFFSFYPSKNLTVGGDGGIVVSNNKQIVENVKMLRDHGRTEKYLHRHLGYNLRFNEIQAAIGKIMLKKLHMRNKSRQNIAKKYNLLLTDNFIKPYEEKWASHVYHMYTIRTRDRDKLKSYLKKRGIDTGIHYPIPIHKQPLFKKYNKIILPVTEEISKTTLSLPMFPTLTKKQQQTIISAVNNFKN